jgi:hypothetical protein
MKLIFGSAIAAAVLSGATRLANYVPTTNFDVGETSWSKICNVANLSSGSSQAPCLSHESAACPSASHTRVDFSPGAGLAPGLVSPRR